MLLPIYLINHKYVSNMTHIIMCVPSDLAWKFTCHILYEYDQCNIPRCSSHKDNVSNVRTSSWYMGNFCNIITMLVDSWPINYSRFIIILLFGRFIIFFFRFLICISRNLKTPYYNT